ncbi:dephospho-CoA kinase [Staphylospora marina]|uniref:dephospho-CoA kinase n=1 Tax=Staphylospora marina TaxID=2490858 RepID=UPI000F5BDB84|nr:dephospho-CoA kinase [Staphylospora marina]
MILGLTGGIATGKSTVSAMFRARGAAVVDADLVAREVVEPGSEGLRKVVNRFGKEMLDERGGLNRRALGDLVFRNPDARKDLNRILHPLIIGEMRSKTTAIREAEPERVIIWDVPLLIEENLTQFVEKVIVVYVPEELQKIRLMDRNGWSAEEAEARIRAQLSIEIKKQMADYVIDNSGTLSETERQVDQLWKSLKSSGG